jgi:hypothetical protein
VCVFLGDKKKIVAVNTTKVFGEREWHKMAIFPGKKKEITIFRS